MKAVISTVILILCSSSMGSQVFNMDLPRIHIDSSGSEMSVSPLLEGSGIEFFLEPGESIGQLKDLSDPCVLGNEILDVFEEMYLDLEEVLSGLPDPEALWPELIDLREDYTNRFLDLYMYHKEMNEQNRVITTDTVTGRLSTIETEAGNSLNRAVVHYRNLDEELADEITDLGTLVQYSLHHPEIF